jgi:hypothetical protein
MEMAIRQLWQDDMGIETMELVATGAFVTLILIVLMRALFDRAGASETSATNAYDANVPQ